MWLCAVPQLDVKDVRATQEYYRDVLGFDIAWLWLNDYGCVAKDDVRIYLTANDEVGTPMTCCLDVDDDDAVHAACVERGGRVVSPLETKPWGMREFTLEDPNGHLLRIGQGVKQVAEIDEFTVGD